MKSCSKFSLNPFLLRRTISLKKEGGLAPNTSKEAQALQRRVPPMTELFSLRRSGRFLRDIISISNSEPVICNL
jgi:hypothetical protein